MAQAEQPSPPLQTPAVAILLVSLSILCFAFSDALVKWIAHTYDATQIIMIRSLVALPLIAMLLSRAGVWHRLREVQQGWLISRVIFGSMSFVTFIQALKFLPLAETIAVSFAGPLFITALSVPLLKETVGPRRWSAVIVGLIGVVIIMRPGAGVFHPAALWALGSAALYAMTAISTRKLAMRTPTAVVLAWVNLYVLIMMTGGVLIFDTWVTPSLHDLMFLIGIGFTSTVGQYLGVEAYRRAQPSMLAPFDYTALVWGAMLGFMFWGEIPSWSLVVGSVVLVASGLYILHRETVRSSRAVTGWRGLRRWR
ncbi:MAG: DMT family transporter [Rhodospirillaceae bacterium]|jgi:drug/metabolite transporter (DMT)-like permease|nr:DMT family transporter [Rhodospirillaceae bacterium]MBT6509467.1 DMT family transporter [Rhodospirillaceae bacterium]MBT7614149.1 DMT family transporter [Rhodospirillaceae bacterium]